MVDENKPFSFETEAQFVETVNKIIGGHVTKRFESFENKLDGKFGEIMTKLTPPAKEEVSEEKLTLKSVQEKFNKEIEKVRQERDAERNANRDKTLRSAITERLAKAGLTVGQQKAVVSMMVNDKLATLNESGEAQFVGEYSGEYVPLSQGIDNWIKTEGKDFLPSPQGARARALRSTPQPQSQALTQEDLDNNLYNALAPHFGKGTITQ